MAVGVYGTKTARATRHQGKFTGGVLLHESRGDAAGAIVLEIDRARVVGCTNQTGRSAKVRCGVAPHANRAATDQAQPDAALAVSQCDSSYAVRAGDRAYEAKGYTLGGKTLPFDAGSKLRGVVIYALHAVGDAAGRIGSPEHAYTGSAFADYTGRASAAGGRLARHPGSTG